MALRALLVFRCWCAFVGFLLLPPFWQSSVINSDLKVFVYYKLFVLLAFELFDRLVVSTPMLLCAS